MLAHLLSLHLLLPQPLSMASLQPSSAVQFPARSLLAAAPGAVPYSGDEPSNAAAFGIGVLTVLGIDAAEGLALLGAVATGDPNAVVGIAVIAILASLATPALVALAESAFKSTAHLGRGIGYAYLGILATIGVDLVLGIFAALVPGLELLFGVLAVAADVTMVPALAMVGLYPDEETGSSGEFSGTERIRPSGGQAGLGVFAFDLADAL